MSTKTRENNCLKNNLKKWSNISYHNTKKKELQNYDTKQLKQAVHTKMTSNLGQGFLSTCSENSASLPNLKLYSACLCVRPTGYTLYILRSSSPLMLCGLSFFHMGVWFSDLNFAVMADSKAFSLNSSDLRKSSQSWISFGK